MKDNQQNELYEFGEFRLDAKKRRLWRGDEIVALTPKEFEVLFVLIKRAGNVVEKDDLLDAVWKDVYVEEATLTRNISFLRKKLGGANYIETVPKFGYRFLPAVRRIENDAALIIEEQSLTSISIEETMDLGFGIADLRFEEKNREQITKVQKLNPHSALRNPKSLWLAFGVLAFTAIGFAVYQIFLKKSEPKTILVSRVAPFSGLAGRETMPAFSPDGKFIAFAWNGGDGDNLDVYVKLVGAGEPVRLTENAADDVFPVFAPDGKSIAFVRSFADRCEIFSVPALGGAERRIAALDSIWTSISFAPDGKTLAAADTADGGKQFGIFLIETATGAKRRLTAPPDFSSDDTPRFSPDGKSIAFVRASGTVAQDLYVVPATGGTARQLTNDKTAIRGAAWNGENIIFASHRLNNQLNLWRVAANGAGEPELIATGGKNTAQPAISADGKTLAFVEESHDTNIWRLKMDEGRAVRDEGGRMRDEKNKDEKSSVRNDLIHPSSLIPHPFIASSRADHSPQFSPDGTRIVFASDRTGRYEIWTAEANGGRQRQLTDSPDSAGSPRFSPDGKWVAYDAQIDGSGDVFIVSIDGGEPRNLTAAKDSREVLPAWSADGKFVFFTSNRAGDNQLWRIPAAGGEAVQITRQGAFESQAAPDGKTVFYSKARGVAGLWKVSIDGADESPIAELAEAVYWRYWTVAASGIYYVARSPNAPYAIKFYDFATRQTMKITATDKTPIWLFGGFAAAPDGKQFLFAHHDQNASSIILAEIEK